MSHEISPKRAPKGIGATDGHAPKGILRSERSVPLVVSLSLLVLASAPFACDIIIDFSPVKGDVSTCPCIIFIQKNFYFFFVSEDIKKSRSFSE
jgi:hypothetical protein